MTFAFRKKLILREKYWLNVVFLSNRKSICWTFFIESNRFDRYFRNNSFFQIAKLSFIFNWMNDDKSLCHFNASFFKQKNKTRNIKWDFSIFAICLKRRMKKSIECLTKSYIIMFCDRKTRKIRKSTKWSFDRKFENW